SDFKVPVLRIVGALEDEVGRDVVRVVGEDVEETASDTGVTNEEIVVCAGRRIDVLRLLERQGSGEAVAEGLLEANAWLTRPAEADVVRGVDRHRQVFCAVVGALFGLGDEGPHLSAGKLEASVGCGLTPELAL